MDFTGRRIYGFDGNFVLSAVLRDRAGHYYVDAFAHGDELGHFAIQLRYARLQARGDLLGLPAIKRRDERRAF